MDRGSGKKLDEECNDNNEAYSEEVLYASWAEVPPGAPAPVKTPAANPATIEEIDVEATLARLYANQG